MFLQTNFFRSIYAISPPFHLKNWKYIRYFILVAVDAAIAVLAFLGAFWLRVESFWPDEFSAAILETLPLIVCAQILTFYLFGMYRQVWRYASLNSVFLIGRCVSLVTLLSLSGFYFFVSKPIPRSIFILFWILASFLVLMVRFSWRVFTTAQSRIRMGDKPRCLIYGAGSAGNVLAQHITTSSTFPYQAVGFIDDDRNKKNRLVHGLKILGSGADLAEICKKERVSTVIIALHSASGKTVRRIVGNCQDINVKPLMLPDMSTLGEKVFQPRPVDIKDLLKRSTKSTDMQLIETFLKNKTVLITGAGGSIGSEIARQVYSGRPKHIILLDASEFNLYSIESEFVDKINKDSDTEISTILGSVRDEKFIHELLIKHKPQVILHAAAFKHVPIIEKNPIEGILNNLLGTKIVAEAAQRHGVEKFLLISSDKAVRPSSIMGATKRCCEILMQVLNSDEDQTCKYSAVRFGNVLGSSGSVLPRFIKQIQEGGPVTVTHPEITRYFMLTSEAVGLVLQSIAMAKGGEIFILNMGQPVKIYEMAKQLIRLAGKEPGRDIEIAFTGLRQGEKLFEELIIEGAEKHIMHEDVFVARPKPINAPAIFKVINHIIESAQNGAEELAVENIQDLISLQDDFRMKRTIVMDEPPEVGSVQLDAQTVH